MPIVATGVLSSPVPGIWRRLSLIGADGSIGGLSDERLVGQLEEMGIPRHQLGLAHLLQSWQRARIPPDVAFALWHLRDRVGPDGCIYRRTDIPVEESSPAIRYIQLAADVGETLDSDPTLRRVVRWLLDRQLPDGSIPLIVSSGYGETGQTSRTLKALASLADDSLTGRLDTMRDYLLGTAIPQPTGAAWAYSVLTATVVTGSTSLAVTALLRYGVRHDVVRQGLGYLLAAQEPGGGWAEVPGHRSTIHNTFNVVRATRTAQAAGVLNDRAADEALDRARRYLTGVVRRRPPRTVLDHAFAVRAGIQLDLLREPRFRSLAEQLGRRRRQFLGPGADTYADTAIAGIALLESSRAISAAGLDGHWSWQWRLPRVAPPFLAAPGGYFYEVLYGMVRARWWVRVVDVLRHRSVIDRLAGLLLGTITALGIVDPDLSEVLTGVQGSRLTLTLVGIAVLVVAWHVVKAAARSSVLYAVTSSGGAALIAAVLTWVLHTPSPPLSSLFALIALRTLVIDVVAFTADSAGLLDRLLPKR